MPAGEPKRDAVALDFPCPDLERVSEEHAVQYAKPRLALANCSSKTVECRIYFCADTNAAKLIFPSSCPAGKQKTTWSAET